MQADRFLNYYKPQTDATIKAFQAWAKRQGWKCNRGLQSAMFEYIAHAPDTDRFDLSASTLDGWHDTGRWQGGKAVFGLYINGRKFEVLDVLAVEHNGPGGKAYFPDLLERDNYVAKLSRLREALNNDDIQSLFPG